MNRFLPRLPLCVTAILLLPAFASPLFAGPPENSYWRVDDVRPGMKGVGRTVMHGTKVEPFDAVVLGVLKNTSPGRDMVLCRLSGLDLDKTGVIAGMSGSPVYIDGKLLGAVAYAWPFGKEPIAGVTPFSQMHGFVERFERSDLAEQAKPTRVGLAEPLRIGGRSFDSVAVAQGPADAEPTGGDSLWMVPLRMPLAATGFSPRAMKILQGKLGDFGLLPVQGGGASTNVIEAQRNTPLEPGGPLSVALITGDFDLSGIGTVTHIEGNRVYGWGHPFLGIGSCDFPLMTGYIHTVYPRQNVSFKLGSPLREVGVINADVSTCVAGWLGRKADMMPLRTTVRRGRTEAGHVFNVNIVRQRSMIPSLVLTALTNAVDMEGEMPEDLTAKLEARIFVEGRDPVVIQDTYSGPLYGGGRAPNALYSQVAQVVQLLVANPYQPVRIEKIECNTVFEPGRRTAEVEGMQLESDAYEPGETVRATVFLRPYQGVRLRVPLELKLPADLPEGGYTVSVTDDLQNARMTLRDNPTINNPQSMEQLFAGLRVLTDARRTNLVIRVTVPNQGVAVAGKALPDLPPGMVHLLGTSRRTGALLMTGAVVHREPTAWVIVGSDSARFTVTRNKQRVGP